MNATGKLAMVLATNRQSRAQYAAMVMSRSPRKLMPFATVQDNAGLLLVYTFQHVCELPCVLRSAARVNTYILAQKIALGTFGQ